MRILMITDRVPYPTISGAPLRSYNLLRRIAREHQVWLAAFVETREQAEGVAHLQEFCQAVATATLGQSRALEHPFDLLRYLLMGRPADFRFSYSEELAGRIRQLASTVDFDVVQIEHGSMGLCLETLPQGMRGRAVWLLHDVDWRKYARICRLEPKPARKLRTWLHSQMTRWWEPRYAERFGCCATVSESDRRLLLEANPGLRVHVVPNGVDTQVYQALPCENATPSLVFVGNMDYRPNVDSMLYFCREVLPSIRRVIENVEMWIVGLSPVPEIRALDGDGVHVTGRVEDVRPYYARSTACVVPLRGGGGTRLKILEAMALGRPVVSTSIGCEGLDVVDGEHLLLADGPQQFAEKTIRVLRDEALRQQITSKARHLVVIRYDWEVIARKLVQIYGEMAARSGPRKAAHHER